MTGGIILAGGKGTRIQSTSVNKVALPFHGKPVIRYGVDLLKGITDPLVIVVGAYEESVKDALRGYNVFFAKQIEQLGTGDAVKCALSLLPTTLKSVIVGYGDHMMFYKKKTMINLLRMHQDMNPAITMITTIIDKPKGYGRIVRNSEGYIEAIIEEKDATEKQRMITEINAGLYCFDYQFLVSTIDSLKMSPITKEYYLTDLIFMAIEKNKKVLGLKVDFNEVGIGINTSSELQSSQDLYSQFESK
ncbi:MAG: sugar phosphate nucleotidyltransferase [bacterium]|nr:sugar phosphate nucleotidyltransferase [bacterium]